MLRSFAFGPATSFGAVERRRFRRRSRYARSALRGSALGALLFAFVLSAGFGNASESPVSLGEMAGTTPSGEFGTPLRSAVRDALDAAKLARARDRFVLSASIETLDAKKDGHSVKAKAVVSIVLRREKEQTLHAILRGSATAEESDVPLDSAREDALRAAVESAMRRLPEALKR